MKLHANAKLGLAGRRELVLAIERGMTLKQAAACFRVSPATAHRWWHRWIEGGRAVAEAFFAREGVAYGTLPHGLDLAAIVERHTPGLSMTCLHTL